MAKQSSGFVFELVDAPGIAPMPIKVRKLLKSMARHHGLRVRFAAADALNIESTSAHAQQSPLRGQPEECLPDSEGQKMPGVVPMPRLGSGSKFGKSVSQSTERGAVGFENPSHRPAAALPDRKGQ